LYSQYTPAPTPANLVACIVQSSTGSGERRHIIFPWLYHATLSWQQAWRRSFGVPTLRPQDAGFDRVVGLCTLYTGAGSLASWPGVYPVTTVAQCHTARCSLLCAPAITGLFHSLWSLANHKSGFSSCQHFQWTNGGSLHRTDMCERGLMCARCVRLGRRYNRCSESNVREKSCAPWTSLRHRQDKSESNPCLLYRVVAQVFSVVMNECIRSP